MTGMAARGTNSGEDNIAKDRRNTGDDPVRGGGPHPSFAPSPTSSGAVLRSLVSTTSSSPWHWTWLEAETAGWLPGDLLGLWIRVDDDRTHPCHDSSPTTTCCLPPSSVEAAAAVVRMTDVGGEDLGLLGARNKSPADKRNNGGVSTDFEGTKSGHGVCAVSTYPPQVCDFVLRTVDDARAREVAGRARFSSRRRNRPAAATAAVVSLAANGRNKGSQGLRCGAGRAETDQGWGIGGGGGGGVGGTCGGAAAVEAGDAVRLDFATVCPMNMAAAGGSWAL